MSETNVLNSLCLPFQNVTPVKKQIWKNASGVALVQNTEVQATVLYFTEIEGDIFKNI